jgi:hypothetical protein
MGRRLGLLAFAGLITVFGLAMAKVTLGGKDAGPFAMSERTEGSVRRLDRG